MTDKLHSGIDTHDLEMVAFDSNAQVRGRNAIFAVDITMRKNYAALKSNLIYQLTPVIIVDNDTKGGSYTLIHNGRRETRQPISPVYELAKSISHTPLGIYSIIAPYLKQPDAVDWIHPLAEFGAVLANALTSLDATDLPPNAKAASSEILERGLKFIKKSIRAGNFSIKSFEKFTGKARDAIKTNMQCAAEAQVEGVKALTKEWKKEIGEEQWKDLYAVVLCIWTTSERNQNAIILRSLMAPENVDSHLITISTAEITSDPVAVALDNLARIVQDNIAADMIFPRDPVLADSLKGPDDLLANALEKIVQCPMGRNNLRIADSVA
jgi:hypothetical protein